MPSIVELTLLWCLITLCLHTYTHTHTFNVTFSAEREKKRLCNFFHVRKFDIEFIYLLREKFPIGINSVCASEKCNFISLIAFDVFDGNRCICTSNRIWKFGHAIACGRIFAAFIHHNDSTKEFRMMLSNACHCLLSGLFWCRTISQQFNSKIAGQESHHYITVASRSRSTNITVSICTRAYE